LNTLEQKVAFAGHKGPALSVAFHPDGALLASGGKDSLIRVWDIGTGTEKTVFSRKDSGLDVVAFSPDGTMLAVVGGTHMVNLWDLASGREKAKLDGHVGGGEYRLAFRPHSRTLVSAGDDRTARFWDTGTGKQTAVLEKLPFVVRAIAFSPDGQLLALAGGGPWMRGRDEGKYGEIQLWEVQTLAADDPRIVPKDEHRK
jgi:WD40 repeat protein